MGDHQDFFKIVLDRVDRFDQSLAANSVLAAETFVNHQGLQARPGALGQHLRERQPDGKIDPEGFPA